MKYDHDHGETRYVDYVEYCAAARRFDEEHGTHSRLRAALHFGGGMPVRLWLK